MSASPEMRVTRRTLLGGAAAAAGTLALGHRGAAAASPPSFDHLLGWVPGANGRQSGLSYRDAAGAVHRTHPLAPDYQGCGHPDPDHSYEGGRVEYDGGRCDGWLRAGANDEYSIGYYARKDLAFLGQAVPQWT